MYDGVGHVITDTTTESAWTYLTGDGACAPTSEEECADSVSWYYKKESKTCATFVSKKAKNCKKRDDAGGIKAKVACPATCGECPCADSTSWYKKKTKKDCDYVSKKSKRCKLKDDYKVKAKDSCPASCGTC